MRAEMTENEKQQPDGAEGKLEVLVVDDSKVARAMIIRTLHLAEIPVGEIREAANGQEALELIDEFWIDLVVADINMPVMNGDEMIERLQDSAAWPPVPVVVISTDGSQPRIEKLLARGVKFLRKPFTPETLREIIVETLEMNNAQ